MCEFLEPLLTCNLQKLELLLDVVSDINSEIPGTEGLKPLHVAVGIERPDGTELVSCLLKSGANPNSRSFDELTPVHIATMWNNCPNLEILLRHGGDPWLIDYEKKNCFDLALYHNAFEAYQLLNKFVSLEMLAPEQKALAYKNGFLNKINMKSHNGKMFDESKKDIIDILLANHDKSEASHFLTANENFPILSSTEDEASELCCNVSKFLKKKNECRKSKDRIYNDCFNANLTCNKSVRPNKALYAEAEVSSNTSYESSNKTITASSAFDTSSTSIVVSTDTEERFNKGFIYSSNDSETSDISFFNIFQPKNKVIEIDSDIETGIVLVESQSMNWSSVQDTSVCSTGSDWKIYQSANADSLQSFCSTHSMPDVEIPNDIQKLSNSQLYEELKNLGDNPGPVFDCTRQIYLQRLTRLNSGCKTVCFLPKPKYCSEIYLFLEDKLDTKRVYTLEEIMSEEFDKPSIGKKWREGTKRCSFNYFLLDPRVTRNLPARAHLLTMKEKFITFLDSLFYVGKGTRGRPYSHLFEAAKVMSSTQQNSEKIKHILDIWNSDLGVISLHCFNNSIPAEAYTREACMIEAIGISNLTNIKNGNFYGITARWTMSRKRQLGVSFLHRAFEIFLLEGERLIRPKDICNKT